MSVDVRATILARIDPVSMRGIEIGPLHNPRLTKDEANIRYLDHESREGLLVKYAGNPEVLPRVEHMVEVDYVWSPGKRLIEVTDGWAPCDYVIASHVIEHTGNMVDWLAQISELLVPGGTLSLVIPDKRYCFDARRGVTPLASFVDGYLRGVEQPTFAQIFDHEAMFMGRSQNAAELAAELWAGMDPTNVAREDTPSPLKYAYDRCVQQKASGEYMDVHASTFTPHSFVDIMNGLAEIGLTTFGVAEIVPTQADFYEFYVTLEHLSTGDRDVLLSQQRRMITRARGLLGAEPAPKNALPRDAFDVSPAEERLVQLKRSVLSALRQSRHRARVLAERATAIRGEGR